MVSPICAIFLLSMLGFLFCLERLQATSLLSIFILPFSYTGINTHALSHTHKHIHKHTNFDTLSSLSLLNFLSLSTVLYFYFSSRFFCIGVLRQPRRQLNQSNFTFRARKKTNCAFQKMSGKWRKEWNCLSKQNGKNEDLLSLFQSKDWNRDSWLSWDSYLHPFPHPALRNDWKSWILHQVTFL